VGQIARKRNGNAAILAETSQAVSSSASAAVRKRPYRAPGRRQKCRRERDEEEGRQARGPSEETVGPTMGKPQESDAKDRGKGAQKKLRAPRAQPEVEEQEEQRWMSEKPAVLIDAHHARRARRLDVERLVGAQIRSQAATTDHEHGDDRDNAARSP
jgi:hypothetical protein